MRCGRIDKRRVPFCFVLCLLRDFTQLRSAIFFCQRARLAWCSGWQSVTQLDEGVPFVPITSESAADISP